MSRSYESFKSGWRAAASGKSLTEIIADAGPNWTANVDRPAFDAGIEAGSAAYNDAMATRMLEEAEGAPTEEQTAALLYTKITRVVAGKPGRPAITALLHALVTAAKSTGADRKALIENLRKLWAKG